MRVLWGTRVGDEDWQEQLITEVEALIPEARAWAIANGFDRLRISTFNEGDLPDFTSTLNV